MKSTILHVSFGGVGGHRSVVKSIIDHDGKNDNRVLFVQRGTSPISSIDSQTVSSYWVTIRRRGDIRSMIEVAAITRRIRPHVSVCHSHRHLMAVFVGMVLARRIPRLVLAEHQSNHLRSRLDDIWSFIGILLSSAVVFLTPDQSRGYPLRRLLTIRRIPDVTIPNGVALPVSDRERMLTGRQMRLGVSGRLIPDKDVATVLHALPIHDSLESDITLSLRVAGEGPALDRLRELAAELGLADRVEFIGAVPSDEMSSFYGTLDVYVHPSHGETLSMSLLEAAACGLPIVASAVPGITDLLTDGVDSLLIPVADPSALADAITQLHDPALRERLGSTARELVRERYSSEATAAGYQRLVARMIDGRT